MSIACCFLSVVSCPLSILLFLLPNEQVGKPVDFLAEHHTHTILVDFSFQQVGEVLLVEEADVLCATIVESPFERHVIDVGTRLLIDGIVVVGTHLTANDHIESVGEEAA